MPGLSQSENVGVGPDKLNARLEVLSSCPQNARTKHSPTCGTECTFV